MISIKLRDFRGCERAEITCGPLALVAGRNAAGKSSLAQAAAAALCGNAVPLAGLSKGSAGMMIRTGASAASVELRSENGTARVDWPACQSTVSGEAPPHASLWASGLDSVALLPAAERAQTLGEYLHADPTREDLVQALADAELDDAPVIEVVEKLLAEHGWTGAHTLRKELGAELKGRWRQATGANWGSRVAASWRPPEWSERLAKLTENDLAAALARAKDEHAKAIGSAALSDAERAKLAAAAGQIETLKDQLRDVEIEEARLEEELSKAEAARAELGPAGAEAPLPCPHCGGLIQWRQVDLATRVLEKAAQIAAGELKRRRTAIAEADGAQSRLHSELARQGRAVETARHDLHLALDAQAQLKKFPAADAGSPADHGVEAAARRVAEAAAQLHAFRTKGIADDLRDKVASNDLLLAILAPDGLRARKLARVVEVFNSTQLDPRCEAADWKPVALDAALTLSYGGRPYPLLSTSEQYRVRAVVQVAMAKLDGSGMVVLDAADVLDGTTRSGLFSMLEEAGLPALVCMTLSRREQVPDLAAAGLGASYWLESGICQPLQPAAVAA